MQVNNNQKQANLPPAELNESRGLRRWIRVLGLTSMLGRHLAISALFMVAIVTVAWTAQRYVTGASQSNTSNLAERLDVNRQILQLSNALWEIETGFQGYMLVGDHTARDNVLAQLNSIYNATERASRLDWIAQNPSANRTAQHLLDGIDRLRAELAEAMEIRADPLKVFPAMPLMVRTLNPLHQEFLGAAAFALDEAAQLEPDPTQLKIHQLFEDLRYAWTQRINAFRMLMSSRLGLYNVSIETGMTAAINDVDVFDKVLQHKLEELAALDKRGQLTFLQSDALSSLFRIKSQWNDGYVPIRDIYTNNDSWRRDVPIIRDTISPLFSDIWKTLRTMESELEEYSADDVERALSVAGNTSDTLWLIALIGLLVTAAGAGLFEFQMRRPLARVAMALKHEADGQSSSPLPRPSANEMKQLVSAFEQMQRQVKTRQERLEAIMRFAAEAIVTVDQDGLVEGFNPAAEKLFGYVAADIIGEPISKIVPALRSELSSRGDQGFADFATTHLLGRLYQERGEGVKGEHIPISLRVSEMHIEDQRLFLAIIEDDRERHAMMEQLRAREQRLQSILDNTAEAIVTFGHSGQIESWNKAAESLFGWREDEIRGTAICRIVAMRPDATGEEPFDPNNLIEQIVGRETETIGHRKMGDSFPLSMKLSRLEIDGQPKFTALIANISERKAMVENLRNMAERDGLTNLFNRTYFQSEFARAVHSVKNKTIATCALLYIDLDNFKSVNDSMGHRAGDELLKLVAQQLVRQVRSNEFLARIGGDEFAVLIPSANDLAVRTLHNRIRTAVSGASDDYLRGSKINCSIGMAFYPADASSENELMAKADAAMYETKPARHKIHAAS